MEASAVRTLTGCSYIAVGDTSFDFTSLESGLRGVVAIEAPRPDLGVRALVRMVRARGDASVVVIADATPTERVTLLRDGADDVVPSAVDPAELAERVRGLAARPRRAGDAVTYGDIIYDPATHLVRRGERVVHLMPGEGRLLRRLLAEPRTVLPRAELLAAISTRSMADQTIEPYICGLRAKVNGPGERRYVRTVRGTGYVFDDPI